MNYKGQKLLELVAAIHTPDYSAKHLQTVACMPPDELSDIQAIILESPKAPLSESWGCYLSYLWQSYHFIETQNTGVTTELSVEKSKSRLNPPTVVEKPALGLCYEAHMLARIMDSCAIALPDIYSAKRQLFRLGNTHSVSNHYKLAENALGNINLGKIVKRDAALAPFVEKIAELAKSAREQVEPTTPFESIE